MLIRQRLAWLQVPHKYLLRVTEQKMILQKKVILKSPKEVSGLSEEVFSP